MDGIILFDDAQGSFGPMTDLRPSFDLRTGILTTAERLAAQGGLPIAGRLVRPELRALVSEAHPATTIDQLGEQGTWLLVNGRMLEMPDDPCSAGTHEIDAEEGSLLRAVQTTAELRRWIDSGETLPPGNTRAVEGAKLIRHPWDILALAPGMIECDLELLGASDEYTPESGDVSRTGSHRITVSADAILAPGVVLDAREGPVHIASGCRLGANAVIQGPCSIGEGTHISALCHIKPGTIIGPHCRIGGEVGASVFQGYANKSHHGHLGDSLVGEWANLGAGTVNSNLLNTYGEVLMRLEPDGPLFRSGRTHMGCIIGDHVKTAIGTRIMTGTVLGTGSMIASTRPPVQAMPRFSWVTDRDTHLYRFEKFYDVAKIFMGRRGVLPTAQYQERLRALHEAMA